MIRKGFSVALFMAFYAFSCLRKNVNDGLACNTSSTEQFLISAATVIIHHLTIPVIPPTVWQSSSAVHFNRVNNYIHIPNAPSINFKNTITLSVWVRPRGFITISATPVPYSTKEQRIIIPVIMPCVLMMLYIPKAKAAVATVYRTRYQELRGSGYSFKSTHHLKE